MRRGDERHGTSDGATWDEGHATGDMRRATGLKRLLAHILLEVRRIEDCTKRSVLREVLSTEHCPERAACIAQCLVYQSLLPLSFV